MRLGEVAGVLSGTLTIAGPAGEADVRVGLGDALGLAVSATGCPILAGDDVRTST